MPELYIITGSNGAGKSSIGYLYVPADFREHHVIFDGDKLFVLKQKELWDNGLKIPKEAKKQALKFVADEFEMLVNYAIENDKSFAYEGHFTNEETWTVPKRFKDAGYKITIIFLGLKDAKLSASRVLDRVEYGGHYVDLKTVENNYYGNLEKLNTHYQIADHLLIVDTSEADHAVLANFDQDKLITSVSFKELPIWFQEFLPLLSEKIKKARSE